MARVLIISNCQSKPLAGAWKMMRPQDEVASYEVHTVKESEIAGAQRRLKMADIILYNPIGDDYPAAFARTSYIQSESQADKLSIPMLFFEGLHPDIQYIGTPTRRVSSPMGDYNSRIVFREFLKGSSPEQAEKALFSPEEYAQLGYFARFEASLMELGRRDRVCAISGRAIVEKHVRGEPSFFTINHPTNLLIKAVVVEVFRQLSLPHTDHPADMNPNSLAGDPVWPIPSCIIKQHQIDYAPWESFKANEGGQFVLTSEEFVRKSFYVYARSVESILAAPQARHEIISLGLDPDDRQAWVTQSRASLIRCGKLRSTPENESRPWSAPDLEAVVRARLIDNESTIPEHELLESESWNDPGNVGLLKAYLSELARVNRLEDAQILCENLEKLQISEEMYAVLADFGRQHLGPAMTIRTAQFWTSRFPLSVQAWLTLSRQRHAAGDIPDALHAAEQAVKLEPESRECLTFLAHRLMDAGQPAMAITQLQLISRKFGENPHDLALQGLAYRHMGQPKQSEDAYSRAVLLEPDHLSFRMGYLESLIGSGNLIVAERLCEEMLERGRELDRWQQQRNRVAELARKIN